MKKLLSVTLFLFLLVSLTGCVTYHHEALPHYGESPVISVELCELPSDLQYDKLPEAFSDPGTNPIPTAQLSEDRVESFLAEVRTWKYADTVILLPVAQDSPREFHGPVVKVTYENGTWEMFDVSYYLYYDGNELSHKLGSVGWEQWNALLSEYFDVH